MKKQKYLGLFIFIFGLGLLFFTYCFANPFKYNAYLDNKGFTELTFKEKYVYKHIIQQSINREEEYLYGIHNTSTIGNITEEELNNIYKAINIDYPYMKITYGTENSWVKWNTLNFINFPIYTNYEFSIIQNNDTNITTVDTEYNNSNILAYDFLTESQKELYNILYIAAINWIDEVNVNTTEKDLEIVRLAIESDHSEIFWIDYAWLYSKLEDNTVIKVILNYIYTEEQVELYKQQIDKSLEDLLEKCQNYKTDYEKALLTYEWLVTNISYDDTNKEDKQSIISALINKNTVCAGYAKSYSYILTKIGIPNVVVIGTHDKENHAWNIIQINGKFYFVDVTGGDSYDDSTNEIVYQYFMFTTNEAISDNYVTNNKVTNLVETEKQDGYFIRNNAYFSDTNEEKIASYLINSAIDKRRIEIQFEKSSDYNNVVDFLTNGHIYNYTYSLEYIPNGYHYTINDNFKTIIFYID